jgi:replicative DNA helicase
MQQSSLNPNQLLTNNYLPHNFLAEKLILSCLLINSEAIDLTRQTLSIKAFYFQNHQEIYRAIIFMHKNNLSIDIITLVTFLQDNGLLEKVGGLKVVMDLLTQFPNVSYLEQYLALVKDKFIRRSLITFGYEVINSSYLGNLSVEQLLTKFENKFYNLTNELPSQTLGTNTELLDNILVELKKKSLSPNLSGLPSGFYDLDALTQGFQKSDLIIIAGRPSMGKTALGLNIALHLVKNSKIPVLFFSLEMSKEQIIYRLLSMETNINQMKLKSGKISENDWIKLNKVVKIFNKFSFFIDDKFNLSIEEIRSKIKTILFEQNQIGLIIIDYIQLLQTSTSKTETRVQELSKITRSLKTLAREFNVPIIALSQLSRNVENRIDKKPVLSDLKESGSIEQDADVVILLYRNTSYLSSQSEHQSSQLLELIVAKQRNGPIGTVKLKFDEKCTRFFDNK